MKSIPRKIKSIFMETVKETKRVGEEDPRRIIHAMKVGFALTLVSLFYYFRPLYNGFGQAGMWAILTVVVVFEFTVGGTLSKSLNRGCATLVAGALGVGAEYLAALCGDKGEPVVLGLMVFVLATTSTFTRFFPNVKRKYDYGVLIFILTFSLVAVSGFRVDQILHLAHRRLSTILIGGASCIVISIFVCPVWAGQDLHNLIAANIEKLGAFLEGFGCEFLIFHGDESGKMNSSCKHGDQKSFLEGYKSVLNSKATEESLANFAWWEPPHGRFRFNHPWKQYLKIGALARDCACLIQSLNGYINSKSQSLVESEVKMKIKESCMKMSMESGKALKELASAVKTTAFHPLQAAGAHLQNSKSAAHDLKNALENSSLLSAKADLQEIMPLLVVASVLIDINDGVDKIYESVNELSLKACFKNNPKSSKTCELHQQVIIHRGVVKPVNDSEEHVVVVVVDGGASVEESPEKENRHPPPPPSQ
ncbi:hypothetical protein ABFS83_12G155200 [Erythranthe nasuta]